MISLVASQQPLAYQRLHLLNRHRPVLASSLQRSKGRDLLCISIQVLAWFRLEVAPGFLLSVWRQLDPCEVGHCPFVRNLAICGDRRDAFERSRLTKERDKTFSFCLDQHGLAESKFP